MNSKRGFSCSYIEIAVNDHAGSELIKFLTSVPIQKVENLADLNPKLEVSATYCLVHLNPDFALSVSVSCLT